MISIPCFSRRCATCKYWLGERSGVSNNYITVDSSKNGKCTKPNIYNNGQTKNAMTDCSAWEKL
jgi:hypothetical protein